MLVSPIQRDPENVPGPFSLTPYILQAHVAIVQA
jgi:hypothetical protein